MKRRIELLSPARTADIGVEAIRHGADAVYIGAPQFGARAAASNSIDDIRRLCDYAHIFGARVYAAFNTILYDDELAEAEAMTHELWRAGTDALIVQDTALLRMNLPPIALHASTQMDITTPEKAEFLARTGFSQLVLARELSLEQIGRIHSATDVPLEAFVHGALCVSYSGRCYASQACFGRSANRGRCAQFCRLPFDLENADGATIVRNRHLLSLRDMNRAKSLEEMMDAGISSFKIEGRLKDADYVKNITAYYRQAIDRVLECREADYERSSAGRSDLSFEPQPAKSFNRGFTDYFLHGRTRIDSFESPKSRGESVGTVERVMPRSFTLSGCTQEIHAGDGLCFIDEQSGTLSGMRVNRVGDADEIFPAQMPEGLRRGTKMFRNHDHAFKRLLEGQTAERRLGVRLTLSETPEGFRLEALDETGCRAEICHDHAKETARTPQDANIRRILTKCGNTPFRVDEVRIEMEAPRFIPASVLTEWRREVIETLLTTRAQSYCRPEKAEPQQTAAGSYPPARLDYTANVANRLARDFYAAQGVADVTPAFENEAPPHAVLMTCKHCLRYALGVCPKLHGGKSGLQEPLVLRSADGQRFPLRFDCARCEMLVLSPR